MKFLSLAVLLVGMGVMFAVGHTPQAQSSEAETLGRECYAPWGARVADGMHVIAYMEMYPPKGVRCRSEWRRCRDGYLWGSYRYQSCYERN